MTKLAIPLASLIVATACGSGGSSEDEGPRTHSTGAAPSEATITATDHAFEAPDTVQAGWNTFRLVNHGEQIHEATLVQLEDSRTLQEYMQAYGEAVRTGGARPEWARFLGGVSGVQPHRDGLATLYLEPGNYAWGCWAPDSDGTPHLLRHDQIHAFEVRPASADAPAASAPKPTVSVGMHDYEFELSEPLEAGKHVIRVENMGAEPHHVLIFKLGPGRTLEDFQAWIQNQMQGEAPSTYVGGMATQSFGVEGYLTLDLPAGDYILVCLVAGRDEVPHFAKGMIEHVRVE